MAIDTNVVRVGILTPDAQEARFTVSIFGIPTKNFFESPGGGTPIREALLEQREYSTGISLEEVGYRSSMFMIQEVHSNELCPPRREVFIQRSKLADDFS